MYIDVPTILDEQQPILEWAKKLRAKHINTNIIIKSLITNDKVTSRIIQEGLDEARQLYQKYNNSHHDNILWAIQVNAYRKQHDLQEGQIVTNGTIVGFACWIDYKRRSFELHSKKNRGEYIGSFSIDDFRKV